VAWKAFVESYTFQLRGAADRHRGANANATMPPDRDNLRMIEPPEMSPLRTSK
jgi:hypothetical protein